MPLSFFTHLHQSLLMFFFLFLFWSNCWCLLEEGSWLSKLRFSILTMRRCGKGTIPAPFNWLSFNGLVFFKLSCFVILCRAGFPRQHVRQAAGGGLKGMIVKLSVAVLLVLICTISFLVSSTSTTRGQSNYRSQVSRYFHSYYIYVAIDYPNEKGKGKNIVRHKTVFSNLTFWILG